MFTGIVHTTGEIVNVEGGSMWVRSELLDGAPLGASVAVDGVCLTVAQRDAADCRFDLTAETVSRTTLGLRVPGDRVNLERPLRASDELGGHVVQGHVDGVGRVERVAPDDRGCTVTLSAPEVLLRYVVEKGSIAVDGVSLTVTRVDRSGFDVTLVGHTLAVTTLGALDEGRAVNLEVDVVAKYVEKLVVAWRE